MRSFLHHKRKPSRFCARIRLGKVKQDYTEIMISRAFYISGHPGRGSFGLHQRPGRSYEGPGLHIREIPKMDWKDDAHSGEKIFDKTNVLATYVRLRAVKRK